ncbi:uncharacterized protein LOC107646883 [Arachis ipaensis]|uniref:uncharacterized protein LOC107646883 n=1 Tax=Arachis ipaensis TaxID=130454 RepID=UPI0007AEFF68|nr:uncharacterized protein LOC107646883 [Arachis ipaensis]
MVAKTKVGENHVNDLAEIFGQIRAYNMRLNPEKCAFGVQARRLRPYFQSHTINVRTSQPLRQILARPDLAGRLIKWSIELSEFDIHYQPRSSVKSQYLADFVAEFTGSSPNEDNEHWVLFVDGASNTQGSGAGILLENPGGVIVEHSLRFSFRASNNQAEYEALIAGLRLAIELQITHIEREQNYRADTLSKLATSQSHNASLLQSTLQEPSINMIGNFQTEDSWQKPYIQYLKNAELPLEVQDTKKFKRQASFFTLLNDQLYRRGYSRPLLKCLDRTEAEIALAEVHEGICGTHSGARSLAHKILRAGFYWPTLLEDSKKKVRTCDHCQKHAPTLHIPAEELHQSTVSWPFNKCGIDILGPFPTAPRQNLKVKQHFSSVEHPQSNGLAEAANKVLLQALRKKLDDAKGLWAELVPEILWGYNTSVHSTTKETPFCLVYGSDAMIPVEISQNSLRTQHEAHDDSRRAELDLVKEVRTIAAIRQKALQQRIAQRHNKTVRPRSFNQGDLVLRKTETARKQPSHGKLAATWDGPYRINKVIGKGAYHLEELDGTILPNTWNVSSLKKYFS